VLSAVMTVDKQLIWYAT